MVLFTRKQRISFQHCDPAGIVFYPRYFEMINETVEYWFEKRLRCPFQELHEGMGMAVPTATLQTDFLAPSRLGDELIFSLRPVRLGRSSLNYKCEARCENEQRLRMTSTIVFIARKDGRPKRWPDDVRVRIENELNELSKKMREGGH